MVFVQVVFWVGVLLLHSGFSAIAGHLLRRVSRGPMGGIRVLLSMHLCLLYLPASLFVLAFPGPSTGLRALIIGISLCLGWIAWAQPVQLPQAIFRIEVLYRTLGAGMAFAAIWGLGIGVFEPSTSHLLVGGSAGLACLAAFLPQFHPRPIP